MLYNIETNKRVKQPYDHISWVHKDILTDTHELKQCFFGEHLINQFKLKPIAIVESEKSAIICSYFLPDYVWLSAGNINGLSIEKFKVLNGRKVVLFPDLNKGFEIWQQKANEFATANIGGASGISCWTCTSGDITRVGCGGICRTCTAEVWRPYIRPGVGTYS